MWTLFEVINNNFGFKRKEPCLWVTSGGIVHHLHTGGEGLRCYTLETALTKHDFDALAAADTVTKHSEFAFGLLFKG